MFREKLKKTLALFLSLITLTQTVYANSSPGFAGGTAGGGNLGNVTNSTGKVFTDKIVGLAFYFDRWPNGSYGVNNINPDMEGYESKGPSLHSDTTRKLFMLPENFPVHDGVDNGSFNSFGAGIYDRGYIASPAQPLTGFAAGMLYSAMDMSTGINLMSSTKGLLENKLELIDQSGAGSEMLTKLWSTIAGEEPAVAIGNPSSLTDEERATLERQLDKLSSGIIKYPWIKFYNPYDAQTGQPKGIDVTLEQKLGSANMIAMMALGMGYSADAAADIWRNHAGLTAQNDYILVAEWVVKVSKPSGGFNHTYFSLNGYIAWLAGMSSLNPSLLKGDATDYIIAQMGLLPVLKQVKVKVAEKYKFLNRGDTTNKESIIGWGWENANADLQIGSYFWGNGDSITDGVLYWKTIGYSDSLNYPDVRFKPLQESNMPDRTEGGVKIVNKVKDYKLTFAAFPPTKRSFIPTDPIGEHKLESIEKEYEVTLLNVTATEYIEAEQNICFKQETQAKIDSVADFVADLATKYETVTFHNIKWWWDSEAGYVASPNPESPGNVNFVKVNDTTDPVDVSVNLVINSTTPKTEIKAKVEEFLRTLPCNINVMKTGKLFSNKDAGDHRWTYMTHAVLEYNLGKLIGTQAATERDKALYADVDPSDKVLGAVDLKTATAETIIRVKPVETTQTEGIIPTDTKELYVYRNSLEAFLETKNHRYADDRAQRYPYVAEEFEVMAGVPTTETMYFNGGSTPAYVEMVYRVYTNVEGLEYVAAGRSYHHETTEDGGLEEVTDYSWKTTQRGSSSFISLEQLTIQLPNELIVLTPDCFEEGSVAMTLANKKLQNANIKIDPTSKIFQAVSQAGNREAQGVWVSDGTVGGGNVPFHQAAAEYVEEYAGIDPSSEAIEAAGGDMESQVYFNAESPKLRAGARTDYIVLDIEGEKYTLLGIPGRPDYTYASEQLAFEYVESAGSTPYETQIEEKLTEFWNDIIVKRREMSKQTMYGYTVYDPWVWKSNGNSWRDQTRHMTHDYSDASKIQEDIEPFKVAVGKPYFKPYGYLGKPEEPLNRNSKNPENLLTHMFAYSEGHSLELTAPNGVYEPNTASVNMLSKSSITLLKDYSTTSKNINYDTFARYRDIGAYGDILSKVEYGDDFDTGATNVNPSTPWGGHRTSYTAPYKEARDYNEVLIHDPVAMPASYVHIQTVPENVLRDQRIANAKTNVGLPKTYIDFDFDFELPHNSEGVIENPLLRGLRDMPADPNELGPGFVKAYTDTSKWIRTKWVLFTVPMMIRKDAHRQIGVYAPSSSTVPSDFVYYNANTWIPLYDDGRVTAKDNDYTTFSAHVPEHVRDQHKVEMKIAYEAVNAVPGFSMGEYPDVTTTNTIMGDGPIENAIPGPGVTNVVDREIFQNPTREPKYTSSGLERQAAHIAYKNENYFDVIGRIGNFVVDDTTDPRWLDVFWQPSLEDLIPNLTKIPIIGVSDRALFYSENYNYYQSSITTSYHSKFIGRWCDMLADYHKARPQRVPGLGINWGYPVALEYTHEFGNLPVQRGSNPKIGLANTSIYLGYPVQWSLQTVGSYDEADMDITPRYVVVDGHGRLHEDISLHIQTSGTYKEIWNSSEQSPRSYTPDFKFRLTRTLGNSRAKINNYERNNIMETLYPKPVKWDANNNKLLGFPHFLTLSKDTQMTYMGAWCTMGRINEWETHSQVDLRGTTAPEEEVIRNAQRWHSMSQLPSSTVVKDLTTNKLIPSEGALIIKLVSAVTKAEENGTSPWNLKTKGQSSYEIWREPIYTLVSVPNEGGSGGIVPPPPGVSVLIDPDGDIPIVVWEIGSTSAKDADIVGTH